ncbi:hypothetical protein [Runella sp.]|uniref:hypothetical protein n=1 Tax=Runella sp. TaxID=1960881 RepID=UPI003D11EE80
MDTITAQGRLVFNIFASLAEFDRIGEPTGFNTPTHKGRFIRCSCSRAFRR